MKAKLFIEVEFDGERTDAESLASAADRLLETALSTPGVLDDYGDPRFGAFFVEQTTDTQECELKPPSGTEDFCPQNQSGHEPDWNSVHVDFDVEEYVDVACKHCGRSGCLDSEETLANQISW